MLAWIVTTGPRLVAPRAGDGRVARIRDPKWPGRNSTQRCGSGPSPIPRPYRERVGWKGKHHETLRGENLVRTSAPRVCPGQRAGSSHNPKVACNFTVRRLTGVAYFGRVLLGLDLVPCVFVVSNERLVPPLFWEFHRASSAVGDGSNPAPVMKRTLGTPTYPEGLFASWSRSESLMSSLGQTRPF